MRWGALTRLFQFLGMVLIPVIFLSSGTFAGQDVLTLNGAGATFPYPLYTKWFSEYRKIDPGVEINYQSIGSGGGIRQLMDRTVDFGASDAPMTPEQMSKATVPILHIPTVLGAVVVTYNLAGIKDPLVFSPDVIADIFLGKITLWNDSRIRALNPKADLSRGTPILVAHRADGSGTTEVFSDYLSKVSVDWKKTVGSGTALRWPVGLGGKGNEGVMGIVKESPGAIGYVELTYARSNQVPFAAVRNRAGRSVIASPRTVTAAAAASLKTMPPDFRISITDAPGADAYPISSFTYLLAYEKMPAPKGAAFVKFLHWALHDGQKYAEPLFYAPLPPQLSSRIEARVGKINARLSAGLSPRLSPRLSQ